MNFFMCLRIPNEYPYNTTTERILIDCRCYSVEERS